MRKVAFALAGLVVITLLIVGQPVAAVIAALVVSATIFLNWKPSGKSFNPTRETDWFRAGQHSAKLVKSLGETVAPSGVTRALDSAGSAASSFAAGYAGTSSSVAHPGGPQDGPGGALGGDRDTQTSSSPRASALAWKAVLSDIIIFALAGVGLSLFSAAPTDPSWMVVAKLSDPSVIAIAFVAALIARRWSHAALAWPLSAFVALVLGKALHDAVGSGPPVFSPASNLIAGGAWLLGVFATKQLLKKVGRMRRSRASRSARTTNESRIGSLALESPSKQNGVKTDRRGA